MKDTFIFDLDGTLTDPTHRLHLVPTENLDKVETWREFNSAAIDDAPLYDVIDMCNTLYMAGKTVIILTGRSAEFMEQAREWLRWNCVNYHMLVMRRETDNRKDAVIKREWLENYGVHRIVSCFDDNPYVIEMMREIGLTVCDVRGFTKQQFKDLQDKEKRK